MSINKNKNLMKRLVNITVLLLFTSVFVSVASAGITIDGSENISFTSHNDSITDGNWISLSGGDPITLPSPFTLTFYGINSTNFTSDAGTIVNVTATGVMNNTNYVITYPYTTHDMFTTDDNVTMWFNGSKNFGGKHVDVYLIKPTVTSLKDAFNNITNNGTTTDFRNMLNTADNSQLNISLDNTGDMNHSFGANGLSAGDYAIFVLRNNSDSGLVGSNDMSILSATTFQVLEYNLTNTIISSEVTLGSYLYTNVSIDASSGSYTYGAVLVHKNAYRAEMQLKFDGTKAGTNLTINGADVIQDFKIAGVGLSSVNKSIVQDIIQDCIGPSNGAVAYDTPTSNTCSRLMSLDTSGLRTGNYILLTVVYESENKLVAFGQDEITVVAKDNGYVSPSGGISPSGGGPSGEAYENIALKTVVQQYLSVNNPVGYTFTDELNPISNIAFTPLINKGYVNVMVEVLKDTSGLVSTPAPGIVYKNMNIWVGSAGWASEQTISNAEIHFKVDKNWIKQMNVDSGDIVLVKHHGEKWTELPTTKTSDDSDNVYYSATTTEFSPFAIIAKTADGVVIVPPVEPEAPDEVEPTEPTPPEEDEEKPWIPGFGAISAFGMIAAVYYMRRRRV